MNASTATAATGPKLVKLPSQKPRAKKPTFEEQFSQWLADIPACPGSEREIAIPVTLTLALSDWLMIAQAAAQNGTSIAGAIELVMREFDVINEWANSGFQKDCHLNGGVR